MLEKAMAPHSSTPAWKIPWMEEPGRLQSMGLQRVGHNWVTSLSLFTFMRWRRKWQPTPVFWPEESQGRGSLVGCRLWGHTAAANHLCIHPFLFWFQQWVFLKDLLFTLQMIGNFKSRCVFTSLFPLSSFSSMGHCSEKLCLTLVLKYRIKTYYAMLC